MVFWIYFRFEFGSHYVLVDVVSLKPPTKFDATFKQEMRYMQRFSDQTMLFSTPLSKQEFVMYIWCESSETFI